MSIVHAEITNIKAEIAALAAWIVADADSRGNESPDWGDHSTLASIRERLLELLANLTNSEADEVREHLREHTEND